MACALPKCGFEIPLESWPPPLDRIFGEGVAAAFNFSPVLAREWAQQAPPSADFRWAMLNVEVWSRLFELGESVDCVKSWLLDSVDATA